MSLRQELQELAETARAQRSVEAQAGLDALLEQLRRSELDRACLQVGETAPDFELPDAEGRLVSLDRALKLGPVVIVFYRGGWCPYCSLALNALQKALPAINALGATLLAISPQLNPGPRATRDKLALSYPLLMDRGNKVARLFGLTFRLPDALIRLYRRIDIDIAAFNGMTEWELPLPATYVIGRNGDVAQAYIEVDFTERAEPADIVGALQGLAAAAPQPPLALKSRAL